MASTRQAPWSRRARTAKKPVEKEECARGEEEEEESGGEEKEGDAK